MRRILTSHERVAVWHEGMPWYHNTDAELNPGDEIMSWTDRNMGVELPPFRSRAVGYSPNNVHMYNQEADPDAYDWFGRHRYEVEPIGDVTRDPEFEFNKKDYQEELAEEPDSVYNDEDVPGYNSYVAPRARVIRRMAELKQDAFGTSYDPEHPKGPTPSHGWPDHIYCSNPEHHGQIAGRCAECHKPIKRYSGLD